jgi:hypothetical protein
MSYRIFIDLPCVVSSQKEEFMVPSEIPLLHLEPHLERPFDINMELGYPINDLVGYQSSDLQLIEDFLTVYAGSELFKDFIRKYKYGHIAHLSPDFYLTKKGETILASSSSVQINGTQSGPLHINYWPGTPNDNFYVTHWPSNSMIQQFGENRFSFEYLQDCIMQGLSVHTH